MLCRSRHGREKPWAERVFGALNGSGAADADWGFFQGSGQCGNGRKMAGLGKGDSVWPRVVQK